METKKVYKIKCIRCRELTSIRSPNPGTVATCTRCENQPVPQAKDDDFPKSREW